MVRQLCERLRWHEFAAVFEALAPRLNFGASNDILELCKIAGVYPVDFNGSGGGGRLASWLIRM